MDSLPDRDKVNLRHTISAYRAQTLRM